MASKIFIGYWRDDSAAAAGRVNDRLEQGLQVAKPPGHNRIGG
jgi:hypothetical protein